MARKQLQTLTEPMYYILLSLLTPAHGYGVMKTILELTDGRVNVGPGTLYALLSRFEKEDIVKKTTVVDNKKFYALTEKGYKILKDEHKRLKKLVYHGDILLGE